MKANWLLEDNKIGDELSAEQLYAQGVKNQSLRTDPDQYQGTLDDLKQDGGYVEQDIIELSPAMENLEAVCAKFVDEHRHEEDEVRFVLAGEGVFDIRSMDDRWMRVRVSPGDLVVVPARRYHRFFLTDSKMIRCVRLFQDASGWVPHYRAA